MASSDRDRYPRERPQPRKRTSSRSVRERPARSAGRTVVRGGAAARPVGGSARPRGKGRRASIGGRRRGLRIALIVLLVVIVGGGITGCVAYSRLVSDLPDLSKGEEPLAETSIIYDRTGAILVELHAEQNRTNVPFANIPVTLRQAVIATEDQRFYEHKGVDASGIARALWVNLTKGKHQGGSTITQQYVVNTFIKRENSITRKIKEAILAYRLESQYSKDEILERYLNAIYFGHGAYGVGAAAELYFGKDVGSLTVAECAMLAGLIRSPGSNSPRNDPVAAQARRDIVLGQMLEQGYIDTATHDAAVAEPITLAPPAAAGTTAPYFVEWVKQTLIDEYGPDAVFKGGLRVKTTIDLAAQAAAENAVSSILNLPEDPSAAVVAIDPKTGEVRALVGGRDFSTQQFNVAVQGARQPGSSFKPFVLVTALAAGVSPEEPFESAATSLAIPGGQTWKVTGSPGGGPMRLRVATEKSINSVYAQLILKVGAQKVADTAKAMGITTPIKAVPAIALGSQEVTPLEMASAYGTLANGGAHIKPFGITEVADVTGAVLFTADHTSTKAIDPAVAYLTTDMLKGVINGGTGSSANIGRPAAGKTGTTQEYRDAWFVGYTPDLVAAVWVGYTEGQVEMTNVHGKKVTGGSFPAQIWASFMKGALAGVPANDFKKPGGLTDATFCLDTGAIATEFCPNKAPGLFVTAKLPASCTLHAAPAQVEVPNCIGMRKDEAIAALTALELGSAVEERPVRGVSAGIVGDQTPRVGGAATVGTVVTLVVSTGDAQAAEPVAAFNFTPGAPRSGDAVSFDASRSSDKDGTIVKYAWEFSDGSPLTGGIQVSHTFTSAGTYEVTLWVTDNAGLVSSVTQAVTVR